MLDIQRSLLVNRSMDDDVNEQELCRIAALYDSDDDAELCRVAAQYNDESPAVQQGKRTMV